MPNAVTKQKSNRVIRLHYSTKIIERPNRFFKFKNRLIYLLHRGIHLAFRDPKKLKVKRQNKISYAKGIHKKVTVVTHIR